MADRRPGFETSDGNTKDGTGPGPVQPQKIPRTSQATKQPQTGNDYAKGIDHRDVAKKLKQDYTYGSRDPNIRALDSLHTLVKYLMKADPDFEDMLEETARLIYSQFNIKEVSIAVKSASDGLFRYVTMYGMRGEVWAAHKKIVYRYEDVFDTKKYKGTAISHQTKLFLAEDNPYGEDEMYTYSEHLMKLSKRKSPEDSIEGDYLDILIYGDRDDLIGWIEISGTWDGRIPNARAVRCLEIVSSILGIAMTRHLEMSRDKGAENAAQPAPHDMKIPSTKK